VAENKLVLDIMAERFMRNSSSPFSDESVYTYNSFLGLPLARESAAYFLARRFLFPMNDPNDDARNEPPVSSGSRSSSSRNNAISSTNGVSNSSSQDGGGATVAVPAAAPLSLTIDEALSHVHPSHVALAAGTSALLNNLFFLLGQEGDACLIPAPYYAAFENDMHLIAGIEPVPVRQANPVLGPTVAELQVAYSKAMKQGFHPRFVLLTNPNNPLGIIYAPSVIRSVVSWARQNNMHTIVDELYALSTHQRFGHGFQSVIKILNNQLSHDVHQIWAISKDFASSGLRVGLLYTQNEVLLEGLSTLGIFTGVSGPMQFLVAELLTDDAFVDRFLNESRARIAHSYEICIHKLEEMVIPFVPATAGLFVYVDFSSLLPEKTLDYERQLSNLMHEYARVVLTPGESQRDALPGMFRICYAWVSPPVLIIAMERLSRLVAKMRRIDWTDLGPRALASVLEK
jgi:aspartate/methionine/tyrosine aminotransferase